MKPLFSNFYFLLSRRHGQSLVEAIVAVSVLLAAFLGIFALLSSSLHNNRIAADSSTATYLAAEGIEVVKNILDHNVIVGDPWNNGFASGDFEVDYASADLSPYVGRNLSFNPTTNVYDYEAGGALTAFTRRIRITFFGGDEIGVNSIVSWTTGQAQSSVNLEDHFLNWRP